MATFNLPILNQQSYDTAVNEYIGAHQSIFEPYMTAKPIPMGSENIRITRFLESNAAVQQDQRFGNTELQDLEYKYRTFNRNFLKTAAFTVDKYDTYNINFDPQNIYVTESGDQLVKAKNRLFITKFKEAVVETSGATGTATTVPFASTNTVAANYVESGAPAVTGLTVAKIKQLRNLAEKNKLIGDGYKTTSSDGNYLVMLVSLELVQGLITETTASSNDYTNFWSWDNEMKRHDSFMGVKFIYMDELLPKNVVGPDRIASCFAWHKKGIIFDPPSVKVFVNTDIAMKENNGIVRAEMKYNILRYEEERCFEVLCKVAP